MKVDILFVINLLSLIICGLFIVVLVINQSKRFFTSSVVLFSIAHYVFINVGFLIYYDPSYPIDTLSRLAVHFSLFLFILPSLLLTRYYGIRIGVMGYMPISYYFFIFIFTVIIFNEVVIDTLILALQVISGSADVTDLVKRRFFLSFESGLSAKEKILQTVILPIATLYFLRSSALNILKLFALGWMIVVALSTLDRWPILLVMLYLLIYYLFVSKSKISKRILYLTAGFLIFLTVFYILSITNNRAEDLESAFYELLSRIFISQSKTSIQAIYYAQENSLGMGNYLSSFFKSIFTNEPTFSRILFEEYHSYTGSASHSTLATFLSDFGFVGLVFSFFYGLAFAFVDIYLSKRQFLGTYRLLASSIAIGLGMTALGAPTGILLTAVPLVILFPFVKENKYVKNY